MVPVYPPEALDHYMSGNPSNSGTSQTQPAANQTMWPAYHQHLPFGYPAPPVAGMPLASLPSQQFGPVPIHPSQSVNTRWTQSTAAAAPMSHSGFSNPNARPGAGPYRAPSYSGGLTTQQIQEHRQVPPPHRRHRRDHDNNSHMNRNHHGYGSRSGRGGVQGGENDYNGSTARQAMSLKNQSVAPEWSDWAASC